MFNRGDIVLCVIKGDYGKPRPAVVVQSDLFNSTHDSLTLCPITSHLIAAPLFRIKLMATKSNGLDKTSQVMVDKVMTLRKDKVKRKVGRLSATSLNKLNDALKLWLNLAT